MLEPRLGAGNAKAQVNADVDFSLVESTSEQHRPTESTRAARCRVQQIVEDGSAPGAQPAGVPGATTNQPPATPTPPLRRWAWLERRHGGRWSAARVGQLRGGQNGEAGARPVGNVRRLSAAVVINHRSSTDRTGKETTLPIPRRSSRGPRGCARRLASARSAAIRLEPGERGLHEAARKRSAAVVAADGATWGNGREHGLAAGHGRAGRAGAARPAA